MFTEVHPGDFDKGREGAPMPSSRYLEEEQAIMSSGDCRVFLGRPRSQESIDEQNAKTRRDFLDGSDFHNFVSEYSIV